MVLPQKLKAGDQVALLAPASGQKLGNEHLLQEAKNFLESWKLKVITHNPPLKPHAYLADSDEQRAQLWNKALSHPEIKAIFTTRGGYGSARLFSQLQTLPQNLDPKWIIGFSDISWLLNYFHHEYQWPTLHGPCIATQQFLHSKHAQESQDSLYQHLFAPSHQAQIPIQPLFPKRTYSQSLSGSLTGGCLSIVVTTLGTPYEIKTEGTFLFLEDVNEKPFRIDRMLTHLRHAGKFEQLQGILFGDMTHCDSSQTSCLEMLQKFFHNDSFFVGYGIPAGHGERALTLPLGTVVELDLQKALLQYTL